MARCILLGTAAALPSATRDNTALVFVGTHSSILVDCPGGAYAKLLRAGVAPEALTHLLLTHTHTDHTYGLPGLLQSLWLGGREAPLPVFGLPTVQSLVDRALEAFTPFGERTPFALLRQTLPGEAADEPVFETEDFRVWTAPTRHSVPSVALRVEARASGVAVVYSSDTAPCVAVERVAAGAELLVHEATYPASAAGEAERFSHTTSVQAAEVARHADARALWLVHFTPHSQATVASQREEAAALFGEGVAVPDDFASHEF